MLHYCFLAWWLTISESRQSIVNRRCLKRRPSLQVIEADETWSISRRDLVWTLMRLGVWSSNASIEKLTKIVWTFINFVLYVSVETSKCFFGYFLMVYLKRTNEIPCLQCKVLFYWLLVAYIHFDYTNSLPL